VKREGGVIAVDYGDRRTGLAASDAGRVLAQPLPTLDEIDPARVAERIASLVAEREASTVVVGLPLLLDGTEGARVRKTRSFVGRLRAAIPPEVEIVEWDERLTTAEAEEWLRSAGLRRERRKEKVDAMAAVLLLRSYLEAQGRRGEI